MIIEAEKVEAEKKEIIMGLEGLDTTTPIVNADAAMVNSVIRNLLVNNQHIIQMPKQ